MTTNSATHDPFEVVVARLQDARPTAKGVRARCPAHEDADPSLDVDRGDDGRVLLACRSARCSTESIVKALGLTLSDLFPAGTGTAKPGASTGKKAPKRHANLDSLARAATWSATDRGRIKAARTTRHDYTDTDGNLVGGVFRFDFADGRPKELRRFRRDGDCWLLKDMQEPRPLYHLHDLVKADATEPVLFVEGEKCVEAVLALGLIGTTSAGGAHQPLHKTDFTPLAGRPVVILPDNDDSGRKYRDGVIGCALDAGAQRVAVLELDGLAEGEDVDDWEQKRLAEGLDREAIRAQLMALIEAAPPAVRPQENDVVEDRPTIMVSAGRLREIVDAAETALIANQKVERIYQRGTQLARVARVDEPTAPRRGTSVPAHIPRIVSVGSTYLRAHFEVVAIFVRVNENGEVKPASCPADVPACYSQSAGHWRLPVLRAITTAPAMRLDGTVLQSPGYDLDSGLLYDPCGVSFPKIPTKPTHDDARAAVARIVEVVRHFDFVDEAALAVWLSALLTSVVRPMLPAAPMFVIDAPTRGSGKSKLANIVGVIATGQPPATMSLVDDVDEVRKRILALLLQGTAVVNIDNVDVPIGGAALCSVLTEPTYSDRILGASEIVRVPTASTWIATGNNTVINGDLTRRVLVCRLDPRCEHPEDRQFDFDPVAVAEQNRPSLVVDALTILRAHAVAGRPQCGIRPFGSFEVWSEVIRAAIVWVGLADPIAGRQAIVEQDGGAGAIAKLLRAWYAAFGDRMMTTRQVLAGARQDLLDAIDEVIGTDVAPGNRGRRLGQVLAQWRDRIVGGHQAVRGLDGHGGTGRWSVVGIGSPGGGDGGNGGNGWNPGANEGAFPEVEQDRANAEVAGCTGAEVPTVPTVPTTWVGSARVAGPDDGLPEHPGGRRRSVTESGS